MAVVFQFMCPFVRSWESSDSQAGSWVGRGCPVATATLETLELLSQNWKDRIANSFLMLAASSTKHLQREPRLVTKSCPEKKNLGHTWLLTGVLLAYSEPWFLGATCWWNFIPSAQTWTVRIIISNRCFGFNFDIKHTFIYDSFQLDDL